MVINNQAFEEQLLKLITDTKSDLVSKEEQKVTIDREVEILKNELQGYEVTLHSYQRRSGVKGHNGIDWTKLMIGAKWHTDQIIVVLKQLGGIARPKEIVDVLYGNGFIVSKRRTNASQIVKTNLIKLIDKGLVEKIDKDYKLIGIQPVMRMG